MINSTIILIAIVLLPGLLWERIDSKYAIGSQEKRKTFKEQLLTAFFFGALTYIVFELSYMFGRSKGWTTYEIVLFKMVANEKQWNINLIKSDIFRAIVISVILSIIRLISVRFRILAGILSFFKVTKEYGYEDYWAFFKHYNDKKICLFKWEKKKYKYLLIFDNETQRYFAGTLNGSMEINGVREILLDDVTVYDTNKNELYKVPAAYISRAKEKILVEFPEEKP